MKRTLSLIATILFFINTQAQEIIDTAVLNKIRKAELSNSHIPTIAHYLTDVAGPRLTNSPGYKRTADWAIASFSKWGLKNAVLEPWGEFGVSWEIQDFSMSMIAPYYSQLRAFASPWSANTNGVIHGQVIVIAPQQYLDSAYMASHTASFKNKIVLLAGKSISHDDDLKPPVTRLADTALAKLKDSYMVSRQEVEGELKMIAQFKLSDKILKNAGALALVMSGRGNVNGVVFVQNEYGYKLSAPCVLPIALLSSEDGQKLKRMVASGQNVELPLNIKGNFSAADTKGHNVIAEIPGTDPRLKSEIVMLGAHLDSWQAATGATDNAAGCVVMMEAVRLLDSLGLKPKRTIRIALWDGEEEGIYGSYGYAKNHLMNPNTFALKPEQAKVSAYFNLDNGSGKIRGIYAQGNGTAKPIFEQWLKPFADLGASTVTLSNTGSTDHLSFDWAGVPGFQFIQDPLDYDTRVHHSNLDDYDHLYIDDLKQAAIIVASFVYQAATRPEMLPRKPLVKEKYVFDGL